MTASSVPAPAPSDAGDTASITTTTTTATVSSRAPLLGLRKETADEKAARIAAYQARELARIVAEKEQKRAARIAAGKSPEPDRSFAWSFVGGFGLVEPGQGGAVPQVTDRTEPSMSERAVARLKDKFKGKGRE